MSKANPLLLDALGIIHAQSLKIAALKSEMIGIKKYANGLIDINHKYATELAEARANNARLIEHIAELKDKLKNVQYPPDWGEFLETGNAKTFS